MQNLLHSNGIFVIEQIVAVQFKAHKSIRILLFQGSVLCGNRAVQHRELTLSLLSDSTLLFFRIRQIPIRLNHQVDILFHLYPAQRDFLIIRVVDKFQAFSIVIYKSATAIQIIVGMTADAVLLCQCLGTELFVRLGLVQLNNSLLAILKAGAVFAQFMFDLCL